MVLETYTRGHGLQFPVYLWVGPLPIHPHWVFETLAFIVGGRLYAHLKARSGDPIDSVDRLWIVAAAFLGAALGSKALVVVDHPALTLVHVYEPLALLDGKTIVGALVGAWVAVEWTKRRLGISRATGDVFAIPLIVGIALGRIGCFLTGLDDNTHGLPADLPWAVNFGDGIPRHPAQLYEIAFLGLVLLPLLVWLARRPHREGDLFKLFMVGYLAFRLALEFLKPGDPIVGLTAIQWVCVAALGWYAYSPGVQRIVLLKRG
jgi:phosphatidylglycerol:prolipoprotein diacylglycerol transferase